jgi:uroporphyrinogen-III synthase
VRTSIPPLAGWNVAVTADRRAEEQVALLERRGASVIVGPTVRTVPLVESEALGHAVDALIARPPDTIVLLTGIGTRALFAAAEGAGRDAELVDALAGAEVVARGPKAAGAGTTVGLDVSWHAASERSSEILERLAGDARRGARIAVQRDGQGRADLADQLAALGADAVDLPVYRWELPEDTRAAARLVDAVIDGDVDVVTFTSSPAVHHLLAIAAADGRRDALLDALQRDVVTACVGPVCAETAEAAGIPSPIVPRRSRLGAMVQALAARFDGRGRTIAVGGGDVVIQGRAVFVDGVAAPVGARERSVLELLADAGGAVLPKARLLRAVWGATFDDEHAVEVAVARLRRGLGPVGAAVQTVPRRGYRLAG